MSGPLTGAGTADTTATVATATARRTSERAQKLYQTALRDAHALEHQAIELLERLISRLENYPAVVERAREHLVESKNQAQRLEGLLQGLGTSRSSLKDTVMSFAGAMAGMMHSPASDEVLKQSIASFAFENYEIASYKTLLVLAEETGHQDALVPLRRSLGEEEAMAAWLDQHIAETTRVFLSRLEAKET